MRHIAKIEIPVTEANLRSMAVVAGDANAELLRSKKQP